MNNYNKAIVEVLEIVKYLDEDLKKIIDMDYLEKIEQEKDINYSFEINKNIPLYDNNFLEETLEILARLFNISNWYAKIYLERGKLWKKIFL